VRFFKEKYWLARIYDVHSEENGISRRLQRFVIKVVLELGFFHLRLSDLSACSAWEHVDSHCIGFTLALSLEKETIASLPILSRCLKQKQTKCAAAERGPFFALLFSSLYSPSCYISILIHYINVDMHIGTQRFAQHTQPNTTLTQHDSACTHSSTLPNGTHTHKQKHWHMPNSSFLFLFLFSIFLIYSWSIKLL